MNKIICFVFCLLLVGCGPTIFREDIFYIKETGERVKHNRGTDKVDNSLKIVEVQYFNGDNVRNKWVKQDDLITEEEYNKSHPAKLEKE